MSTDVTIIEIEIPIFNQHRIEIVNFVHHRKRFSIVAF